MVLYFCHPHLRGVRYHKVAGLILSLAVTGPASACVINRFTPILPASMCCISQASVRLLKRVTLPRSQAQARPACGPNSTSRGLDPARASSFACHVQNTTKLFRSPKSQFHNSPVTNTMAAVADEDNVLKEWRQSLKPRKVDIVGDFAGKELLWHPW